MDPASSHHDESLPPPSDDEEITISLSFLQASMTATERYLRAQFHLQNLWTLSHITTIAGSVLYFIALLTENTHLEGPAYKIATWGTVTTYSIVLYRANFEEQVVQNEDKEEVIHSTKVLSVSELMRNENAQLLGYVILWIFTDQSFVKLVPFSIYSVVNLLSYFTMELIPGSAFSEALLPLFNYFEIPLLITASHFDLLAMFILATEAWRYGSAYPLVIYICVWALRYENSEISRSSFKLIVKTIDGMFLLNVIPARIQEEYILLRSHFTFMIPLDIPTKVLKNFESNGDAKERKRPLSSIKEDDEDT